MSGMVTGRTPGAWFVQTQEWGKASSGTQSKRLVCYLDNQNNSQAFIYSECVRLLDEAEYLRRPPSIFSSTSIH